MIRQHLTLDAAIELRLNVAPGSSLLTVPTTGSRGPAVLDDFTSSYGYKFSDPAGYQWGNVQHNNGENSNNKL